MCEFKSMILLKDRVFCPADTDEHSKMLEVLGIKDNKPQANFVKVEIRPPDGDVFAPLKEWVYAVDQDNVPDWYVQEVDEKRARVALEEWAKDHIIVGKKDFEIKTGYFYLKDCENVTISGGTVNEIKNSTINEINGGTVNEIRGGTVNGIRAGTVNEINSGTVKAIYGGGVNTICGGTVNWICGGTVDEIKGGTVNEVNGGTVNLIWGGTIKVIRGGTVNEIRGGMVNWIYGGTVNWIYGGTIKVIRGGTVNLIWGGTVNEIYDGTIKVIRGGTVNGIWGRANVKNIRGDATVTIPKGSSKTAADFIISENATLKDSNTKTIYHAGDWSLVKIEKGAQ